LRHVPEIVHHKLPGRSGEKERKKDRKRKKEQETVETKMA